MFTANSAVQTYNYTPDSIVQFRVPVRRDGTRMHPVQNFQGGTASGEPVDGWTNGVKNGTPLTKASYQDEFTIGVEKALDPTLSVGLKGTYRTLGRTVEDRCDLDGSVAPNTCALFNPGGDGQAASGDFPTLQRLGQPDGPDGGRVLGHRALPVGDAKRIFRGIELMARKQFTNEIWAQASFLYSSLKGNYSGAIREATGQTDPGINADYDYYQFTFNDYGNLELDRPVQARLDAVYNAPFGLSAGVAVLRPQRPADLSTSAGSTTSTRRNLYLEERGTFGRTPTDYDLNLSLGYNLNVGPVTVTPQLYVFNLLNRQTTIAVDSNFNVGGAFVTDPTSPFYGQPGSEPGTGTCAALGHRLRARTTRTTARPRLRRTRGCSASRSRSRSRVRRFERSLSPRGRLRPPPFF